MAFPSVALLDNFTRTNEGPPPSASWVNTLGTGWKVLSNEGVPSSVATGGGAMWNTSYGADQEVAVTISAIQDDGIYSGILLRTATADYASDHYEVDFLPAAGANNDTIEIYSSIGGVFTQLGATIVLATDFTAGDTFGARMVGTSLEVYRNGVLLATRTDGDITAGGYTGMYVLESTTATMKVTAFYAGAYVEGQPTTKRGGGTPGMYGNPHSSWMRRW